MQKLTKAAKEVFTAMREEKILYGTDDGNVFLSDNKSKSLAQKHSRETKQDLVTITREGIANQDKLDKEISEQAAEAEKKSKEDAEKHAKEEAANAAADAKASKQTASSPEYRNTKANEAKNTSKK